MGTLDNANPTRLSKRHQMSPYTKSSKVYPLSPVEQKELDSFLEENLRTGDGDQREFDLETRVTTNGNRIISEMFHSCALNK